MEPIDMKASGPARRAHPRPKGVTFGEELRRERELRGIDIREIAEATKVHLRFLEALERNEFEVLPGGLFTRGFIRAYASHIGADPDRLVNAYLFQVSQDEERAQTETDPDRRAKAGGEAASPSRWRSRGSLVLILVAAAAVSIPFWVFVFRAEGLDTPTGGSVEPVLPARPPAVTAAPATVDGPRERVLEILAEGENRVQLTCAGAVRIDRTLAAGERAVVRCAGELRLDASNGGALELTLDGEPLGAPGTPDALLLGWKPPAREPPA